MGREATEGSQIPKLTPGFHRWPNSSVHSSLNQCLSPNMARASHSSLGHKD